MDCARIADDRIMERYLLHELDDAEQEALEQHFFECDECFSQLEVLQSAQEVLAAEAALQALPIQHQRRLRMWRRAVAAAAVLVIGLVAVAWWVLQPPSPETVSLSPKLAELARIEAPSYAPVRLRGAANEAQQRFRTAMEFYSAGDYLSAIPGLQEAANLDPEAPNISFYLGSCYLLTDRTSEGLDALQNTIDLGDTPFIEEALILTARARISLGDIESARKCLLEVIELEGDLAAQSHEILEVLVKQNK